MYGAAHDARGRRSDPHDAQKIERELGATPGDLKIGPGGIMDVEFAAQYLQLVHGHFTSQPAHHRDLSRAARRGIAGDRSAGHARAARQGYRFLRRIEQRLRVVHDQPIHKLPEAA